MKEKGHFWFSEKKEQVLEEGHTNYKTGKLEYLPKNYALIKGKVIRYNEWTDEKEPSGLWGDYVYLGKGKYHHSEPRQ